LRTQLSTKKGQAVDYVTVRELREKSGEIWQRVEAGEEFVVTRNGKPFALLVHTEPSEVDAALRAYRAARFGAVFARLQAQAQASGASKMTDAEIQAEVDAVRAERRAQTSATAATRRRTGDARRR
jgi:prevent-host-death family protein